MCMTPKLILTRYIILGLSFLCFWLFWWSLGGRTQNLMISESSKEINNDRKLFHMQ